MKKMSHSEYESVFRELISRLSKYAGITFGSSTKDREGLSISLKYNHKKLILLFEWYKYRIQLVKTSGFFLFKKYDSFFLEFKNIDDLENRVVELIGIDQSSM
jgi:hypothetical protein